MVGVAGKVAAGVSAGVVVGGGRVGVMDSAGVVAAVVGSMAGLVGVGVAVDWQPMRKTAERSRVNVRFCLSVTSVNVTFCPILYTLQNFSPDFLGYVNSLEWRRVVLLT